MCAGCTVCDLRYVCRAPRFSVCGEVVMVLVVVVGGGCVEAEKCE